MRLCRTGEVVFSALAGQGGRAGWHWRKGEKERHFDILLRSLGASKLGSAPAFVFDHDSTPDAHFIAESGNEVAVAAWEAHAQDRACWCVGEGYGEIAKGGEGAEVGEDEGEVLNCSGEIGCQG